MGHADSPKEFSLVFAGVRSPEPEVRARIEQVLREFCGPAPCRLFENSPLAIKCAPREEELRPAYEELRAAGAHVLLMEVIADSESTPDSPTPAIARFCEEKKRALERLEPSAVVKLGSESALAGRHAEAAAYFREALRYNTRSVEAYLGLGRSLQVQGKLRDAWYAYERAVEIDPASSRARLAFASILEEAGYGQIAVLHLNKALQSEPGCEAAREALQRLQGAGSECAEPAPDQRSGPALFAEGNSCMQENRFKDAITAFSLAAAALPDRPEIWLNLGNAYFNLGRLEEAAARYREALRLNSGCAEAYCNLANVLNMLLRHEEAIDRYKQALALKADHIPAWLGMINANLRLGRTDEVERCAREVLERDPKQAEKHPVLVTYTGRGQA
jgi:tetratricopeptide (TPR) repeat protein